MKPAIAAATLLALPTFGWSALDFDLFEDYPPGYDTEEVNNGDWDDLQSDALALDGGNSTVAQDANGGLQFTYDGTTGIGDPNPSRSISYGDLVVNNVGTKGQINEFAVYYTYQEVSNGATFSPELLWSPFIASDFGTQSEFDDSFVDLGTFGTGTGQTFSFQGEDAFRESGNDPDYAPALVPLGDSGTLRFQLTGIGDTSSQASASLTGLTITAVIPEPSSALLLTGLFGFVGTWFRRRRKLNQ